MIIAPSLLDVHDSCLGEKIRQLTKAGADWMHVDVIAWGRTPAYRDYDLLELQKAKQIPYNVHLMVDDPYLYTDKYASLADSITLQSLSEPKEREMQLRFLERSGIPMGFALNPNESFFNLESFLPDLHHVLFMSVYSGYGGQGFLSSVIPKIREAFEYRRKRGLQFLIGIDGGVNDMTIQEVAPYIDYCAVGSYLMKADDQKLAIEKLRSA